MITKMVIWIGKLMSNLKMKMKIMKKFLLSMSLMFVALTLTSCAKDAAEENVAPAGKGGFSFVADVDSRATVDGLKTVWEAGDQVAFGGVLENTTFTSARLFGFDYADGKFSNAISTFTAANQFYAVWPSALESGKYIEVYTSINTENTPHQTKSYFNVGYTKTGVVQKGASASHIPAVSPMYYMSEGAVEPSALAVKFHHTTALMKFTVKNTEETPISVASLRFAVPMDTKICGTYYINLSTGELVASGATYVYNYATVDVEEAPAIAKGESFDVYMAVAPFALAANDEISILVTTADGATCTISEKVAKDLTFAAGTLNTKTVEFKKDAVVSEEWTVDELVAAINDGTVAFTGKRVKGYVAAMAADGNQTLSNGTLILVSNSGKQNSAVKLFDQPTVSNRAVDAEGLQVGYEVLVYLDNAEVNVYGGNNQLKGVTADEVEIQSDKVNDIVATTVTIAEYNANYAKYENMYLAFENVEPSQEYAAANASMTFTDGTSTLTVYNNKRWTAGAAINVGKQQGTFYGFAQSYNGAPQLTNTDVKQLAAFMPTCTLSANKLSFAANAAEAQTVVATLGAGCTLGDVVASASWVTATVSGTNIAISVSANSGEERTATVTVNVLKDGKIADAKTIAVTQKKAGAAAEQTAEFVFSEFGWENAAAVSTATKDDITITFSKGSASNDTAYYNTGTAVRMYPKSSFKVAGATVTKVEFTYEQNNASKGVCSLSADAGSIDETAWAGGVATWTGSGEPTFTVASTKNGALRVSKMVVYYE